MVRDIFARRGMFDMLSSGCQRVLSNVSLPRNHLPAEVRNISFVHRALLHLRSTCVYVGVHGTEKRKKCRIKKKETSKRSRDRKSQEKDFNQA